MFLRTGAGEKQNMTYTLNWSSSSKAPLTVAELSLNSNTSLVFTGKGYPNYGEILQENFLKLLDNFSNDSAPSNPTLGQLWFNSQTTSLNVYDGSNWKTVGNTKRQSDAPAQPSAGDLWWDTLNASMKIYDGANWNQIWPTQKRLVVAGAEEYNKMVDIYNLVAGTPSGESFSESFGYGQTPLAYENNTTISNAKWLELIGKMKPILQHQGTDFSGLATRGFILTDDSSQGISSALSEYNATFNAFISAKTNAHNVNPSGQTFNTLATFNRTTSYFNKKSHDLTYTFDNINHIKSFFNAGGKFKLSSSFSPSTSSAFNTEWANFISGINASFSANGTALQETYTETVILSGPVSSSVFVNNKYIGVGGGKFYKSNDGLAWTQIADVTATYGGNTNKIVYNGTVLMAADSSPISGSTGQYLLYSTDEGVTWQSSPISSVISQQGNWVVSALDTIGDKIMICAQIVNADNVIYFTTINGTSIVPNSIQRISTQWVYTKKMIANDDPSLGPQGKAYVAATSTNTGATQSIFYSSSLSSWTQVFSVSGYNNRIIDMCFSSEKNRYIAVGLAGRIYTSTLGNAGPTEWTTNISTTRPTPNDLYCVRFLNGFFYAVGTNGTILASSDGINWVVKNVETTGPALTSIYYDSRYGTLIAFGSDTNTLAIYTSHDNGETWQRRTNGTTTVNAVNAIQGFYDLVAGTAPIEIYRKTLQDPNSSGAYLKILASYDIRTNSKVDLKLSIVYAPDGVQDVSPSWGSGTCTAIGSSTSGFIVGKPSAEYLNSPVIEYPTTAQTGTFITDNNI
jgi:photosystem II stability/assembly factor-like uncharacterized protein